MQNVSSSNNDLHEKRARLRANKTLSGDATHGSAGGIVIFVSFKHTFSIHHAKTFQRIVTEIKLVLKGKWKIPGPATSLFPSFFRGLSFTNFIPKPYWVFLVPILTDLKWKFVRKLSTVSLNYTNNYFGHYDSIHCIVLLNGVNYHLAPI
jgi:hypothetical protein